MRSVGLQELLGVRGSSIRWERTLLFLGRVCDAVNALPPAWPAAA